MNATDPPDEAPDPPADPEATELGSDFVGDYPEQTEPDAIDQAAP